MRINQFFLVACLLTYSSVIPTTAIADEKHKHDHHESHRQHDAHVHGAAALNLALEGSEIHVEFESPAANIVGFEHKPSTDADHASLDKAVAVLKAGSNLFRFNDEAGCQLEKAEVESELLEEGHSEDGKKHKHDHSHEKHDDGETHSNIKAVYHFECDNPEALTELTVELFDAFPATEEIKVQYVVNDKQGARELTMREHVFSF